MSLNLSLPFPPSLNHYWRAARGRFYISDKGEAYRDTVIILCRSQRNRQKVKTLRGRLCVEIGFHAPDNKRRDLDNFMKVVIDALTHAGAYGDDSQIDDLRIVRGPVESPAGRLQVHISEI